MRDIPYEFAVTLAVSPGHSQVKRRRGDTCVAAAGERRSSPRKSVWFSRGI
jgi:hypothetical protein